MGLFPNSTVDKFQATVVSLLLTTFGDDGGHGQVASTVD